MIETRQTPLSLEELPADALAIIARESLEHTKESLTIEDQQVNKLSAPVARAASTVDFLQDVMTANQALQVYLAKSSREITLCRRYELGILGAGPAIGGLPWVFMPRIVLVSNGASLVEPSGITKLNRASLEYFWQDGNERTLIRKLANQSKTNIFNKVLHGLS